MTEDCVTWVFGVGVSYEIRKIDADTLVCCITSPDADGGYAFVEFTRDVCDLWHGQVIRDYGAGYRIDGNYPGSYEPYTVMGQVNDPSPNRRSAGDTVARMLEASRHVLR